MRFGFADGFLSASAGHGLPIAALAAGVGLMGANFTKAPRRGSPSHHVALADTDPLIGVGSKPFEIPSHDISARRGPTSPECPLCGHASPLRRSIVQRGHITLRLNPTEIRWKDGLVPLTTLESEMLALLICRGRVSWETFDQICQNRGASAAAREVMLFRIRKKFAAAGAPDPAKTQKGWGLVFNIDGYSAASQPLVIGAAETWDPELKVSGQGL